MLRSTRILISCAVLGLCTACGSGPSQLYESERAGPYEIEFDTQPSYLPSNFIALTFDDVPDWNHTAEVLDVLQEKDLKTTFFINTYNWSDVANEIPMQALIQRMSDEGHTVGNHTARHQSLPSLAKTEIESEITTVENLVKKILGPASPPLTLLRAPYGEPYQNKDTASADYQKVSSVVSRHAVHIGWAIDALDYDCPEGDADCAYNGVMDHVDEGAYGIVLMHGTYAATVGALPRLIDELRYRGYTLGTVEDVVEARYGKTSRQLLNR